MRYDEYRCSETTRHVSVNRFPEHLFGDFESNKQIFSDMRSPEHPLGVFKMKTQNLGDLRFSEHARTEHILLHCSDLGLLTEELFKL